MARKDVPLSRGFTRPTQARAGITATLRLAVAYVVWRGIEPSAFAPPFSCRSCTKIGLRGTRLVRAAGADVLVSDKYMIGDHVEAISEADGQWYRGRIHSSYNDTTFNVRWDDPDGGPETTDVDVKFLNKVKVFNEYAVGDHCQARSPGDNEWYPGTVLCYNQDGSLTVAWDSPDGGPDTSNIEPHNMIKSKVFKNYKPGDKVQAASPDNGRWCPGMVKDITADSTFVVRWDDPGDGPEESQLGPQKIRFPRFQKEELVQGRKYQGTVLSIQNFGAFVDIGADFAGLLHISKISEGRLGSIYNHLREGQAVDVWIRSLSKYGFELSMFRKDVLTTRSTSNYAAFEGISPTQWLEGCVDGLSDAGAFVTVRSPEGEFANGWVPKSRMEWGLRKGDQVEVRVLRVDQENRRMTLSMTAAL